MRMKDIVNMLLEEVVIWQYLVLLLIGVAAIRFAFKEVGREDEEMSLVKVVVAFVLGAAAFFIMTLLW